MSLSEQFPEITRCGEPLAPYTHVRIGGPAEYLVQPRTVAELSSVLKYCHSNTLPLRMLGGGYNLLVRDEPVRGAVMRLHAEPFRFVELSGTTLRAGGGAGLYEVIAAAVAAGLGGLETLIGLRGTVGGSVRCNVGDRSGEIGTAVRRVAVMTEDGMEQIRTREELSFGDHQSDLDEPVILWVEFALSAVPVESLLKRMRKAWITRKNAEPLSFQTSLRMFRNPTSGSATSLIERASLAKTRIGGAEVSDRNGNYVIAHPGTTANDLLELMDKVSERVKATFGVQLERELNVW